MHKTQQKTIDEKPLLLTQRNPVSSSVLLGNSQMTEGRITPNISVLKLPEKYEYIPLKNANKEKDVKNWKESKINCTKNGLIGLIRELNNRKKARVIVIQQAIVNTNISSL